MLADAIVTAPRAPWVQGVRGAAETAGGSSSAEAEGPAPVTVLALFEARGGGRRDLVPAVRGGAPVDRGEGQRDHADAHHEGEHPGHRAVPAGLLAVGAGRIAVRGAP